MGAANESTFNSRNMWNITLKSLNDYLTNDGARKRTIDNVKRTKANHETQLQHNELLPTVEPDLEDLIMVCNH